MIQDVLIYDAFTEIPGKGNPAGVVLNADGMTDEIMQKTATALGYNESAFVCASDKADFRIKYFAPGHEVPVCGHATVASCFALQDHGITKSDKISIETGAGILEISIVEEKSVLIGMQQCPYAEKPFTGNIEKLAKAIGLTADDIDDSLPIVYGSTGLWALFVPVKNLNAFSRMVPENSIFPEILTEFPHASIHPFCLETYHKECLIHGRHFSSPFSGTLEDPVTGTASGAVGAYFKKHVDSNILTLKVEQGMEIGKDGIVEVCLSNSQDKPVLIYGTAVYAGKHSICL